MFDIEIMICKSCWTRRKPKSKIELPSERNRPIGQTKNLPPKIFSLKYHFKNQVWRRNYEEKKRLRVTSNAVETDVTLNIWDMYKRKVHVSDELIYEKAYYIQIF